MAAGQLSGVAEFRRLHESGCFVLPNPWNVGTAIALQRLGFKALASTSAGFAFSRGKPDGHVPRDEMLAHIQELAGATPLPVNADFLNAFADDPSAVAENVKLCVGTGVAGLSVEDATGNAAKPLYEEGLAIERMCAARKAIDATGISVMLTGRCEAFLVEAPDPLRLALHRLVSYAEAGADCLYAPGLCEPKDIAAVVRAVAPKPVNVLVSGFNSELTVPVLADLGVRRISIGSGLAAVAWGAFLRASREVAELGSFNSFAAAAPSAELNALFRRRD